MPEAGPKLDRRVSFAVEGELREAWAARSSLEVDSEGARAGFVVRYFERAGGGRVRPADVGKLTDDHGQPWNVVAVAERIRRRFLEFNCEALTR